MNTEKNLHSANWSGWYQKTYKGTESLIADGSELPFSMLNFWQWAYSDLIRNTQRGVIAEYIVKSALELDGIHYNNSIRCAWEPYDLLGPDIYTAISDTAYDFIPSRLEVKSSAHIQAWKSHHPDKQPTISFRIAKAKVPDELGDYSDSAPKQRNSDIYIFCEYMADSRNQNILDTDLWQFYVVPTCFLNTLDGIHPDGTEKVKNSITAKELTKSGYTPCKFTELSCEIKKVCETISYHSN